MLRWGFFWVSLALLLLLSFPLSLEQRYHL
jgi:hypothetical protein